MKLKYLTAILVLSINRIISQNLLSDSNFINLHFQQTIITQGHPSFPAKYSGPNSLNNYGETETSITSTLFLGIKIFQGLSIYFNPELSGGSGISSVTGLAGFPNGETYRISNAKPIISPARLFMKYTFNLDDQLTEEIKEDQNQLPEKESKNSLSIIIGKFSVLDFFDDNEYSHDPRTQFMNWAVWSSAAWDYPADTRGYTYGTVIIYKLPFWKFQIAGVMEPKYANGLIIDAHLNKAYALAFEADKKYYLSGLEGTARFIAFLNKARMGSYQDAVNNPAYNDNITLTESYSRLKYGLALNIEQKVSANAGGYFRLSWNDGKTETWAFTEIDNAISLGVVWDHVVNKAFDDNFGIAIAVNGISSDHQNYLAKGGLGFIIGDGKLNYGNEMILETYYKLPVTSFISLSPDYQFVVNPAYNKDRGPVHIFAIRIHTEF